MGFTILTVGALNGCLCVDVEHFNADGSHRFYEEYLWQGREGDRHKRVTNDQGNLLMDDDDVAPVRLKADGDEEQYLPAGREWKLDTARPHMGEDSILQVIRSVHAHGRPQGYDGRRNGGATPSDADRAGVGKLGDALGGMQSKSYDR
jgi:hypothetical protein